CQRYSYSPLTF
nr:immunoglobulin light chain junction region [Macaca mulatta]MOW63028.1 immunoglobulin light chain junction region [Macaca mulatta]MOW63789.1 immunoglobulin light chain junction region [Macaca mulatta]